jgi:6-phosphogluconolactonase
MTLLSWDNRRDYIVLQDHDSAISFATEHWIHSYQRAIQQKGSFTVALSGGSTPKAIYEKLAHSTQIAWDKVYLFWSDERSVPPDHPESNYKMAMDAGFRNKVHPAQVFRMKAESDIDKHAKDYEEKLQHHLIHHSMDLVMLGVGEDGHIASLFPNTSALNLFDQLVAANYVPEKNTWRMTFTYSMIHRSDHIVIYALGDTKRHIIDKVLNAPILSQWPASKVGTPEHKALWVLDKKSAAELK